MTHFKKTRVRRVFGLACFAGAVLGLSGKASAQYTCGGRSGPDVIVGDLQDVANYTSSSGVDAISVGTTSCNPGTSVIQWQQAPANTHPVIAINLYRYSNTSGAAHFDQIGMSWVKYAFCALQGSVCCTCTDPGHGCDGLAVGCSDPYTASRNGTQSGLGPRYQINAHTGFYPAAQPVNPTGTNTGRTQYLSTDVTATTGGSAATVRFFVEGHYVTADDAVAGNGNNNQSYRELSATVTTGEPAFSLSSAAAGFIANTQRAMPAVRAWKTIDPTVTQTDVQVPNDGVIIVSSKATSLGAGVYHYEYNVYNMNADRNVGSFSVPISDAIPATNIGFSCPVYRGGDGAGGVNESSTTWTSTKTGGNLTWSCETQAANANANAIRWGTAYSFRFDAAVAPVAASNVGFGLWKAGSPGTMVAAAQSPGQFAAPLSGAGGATPNPAQITTTTVLTVQVSPGTLPTSTGVAVSANLSAIHGSATQTFYDDGTHGDAVAGDGIYSYLTALTEPLSAGTLNLPFSVTDAQARSSNGTIALTLTSAPTGQCCNGTTCSVASNYACTSGGGTWAGVGTNCGASAYTVGAGGSAYATIAGNGGTVFPSVACDDCVASLNLPFGFTFFGTTYSSVWVSSNGNLQFGASASNSYTPDAIPSPAAPNNGIYPLWEDLNSTSQGGTYYKTVGSAPNRSFIVEWFNVPKYGTGTSENFQVVFTEGSNNVEFRYGAITGGGPTIGIENATGTAAYSVPASTVGTGHTSLAVTYVPPTTPCQPHCGSADFNHDGDVGTDADIEAFFACLGGNCCAACDSADFNQDGDTGTDADIESFFRVLGGGAC